METMINKFINAIPENVYDPCPCGCGKTWRYVIRDNEIDEHVERFLKGENNDQINK